MGVFIAERGKWNFWNQANILIRFSLITCSYILRFKYVFLFCCMFADYRDSPACAGARRGSVREAARDAIADAWGEGRFCVQTVFTISHPDVPFVDNDQIMQQLEDAKYTYFHVMLKLWWCFFRHAVILCISLLGAFDFFFSLWYFFQIVYPPPLPVPPRPSYLTPFFGLFFLDPIPYPVSPKTNCEHLWW